MFRDFGICWRVSGLVKSLRLSFTGSLSSENSQTRVQTVCGYCIYGHDHALNDWSNVSLNLMAIIYAIENSLYRRFLGRCWSEILQSLQDYKLCQALCIYSHSFRCPWRTFLRSHGSYTKLWFSILNRTSLSVALPFRSFVAFVMRLVCLLFFCCWARKH